MSRSSNYRPQRSRNYSSGTSRSQFSNRSSRWGSNSVPSSSSSWRTHSASASRTNNNKKQLYTFARKSPSPSKSKQGGAYCYSLNLQNGKKYVGYTTDINRRLNEHFSGRGAKVTQQLKPLSVNHVQKCKSVENARKAEATVYNNMKNYHGTDQVRGAGHTKRFFPSRKKILIVD